MEQQVEFLFWVCKISIVNSEYVGGNAIYFLLHGKRCIIKSRVEISEISIHLHFAIRTNCIIAIRF